MESLTPERVLKTTQRPMEDLDNLQDTDNEDALMSAAEDGQSSAEDAGASTNGVTVMNGAVTEGQNVLQPAANGQGNDAGNAGGDGGDNDQPIPLRYLRLRDFNPYSVKQRLKEQQLSDQKGKRKISWREPFVVTERSTMDVKGIFKHDITSWLPYVEVVSEEMFEVTDVMMDDCRLLLLRVGVSCKSPR